jgi:hypothetical protein
MVAGRIVLLSIVWALVAPAAAGEQPAPASPFLPPQAAAAAQPTENAPIEFRGILVIGGKQRFNFFDPAKRQSTWVGLNEPGAPYLVSRYDAGTESVLVDAGGRSLTLTLQKATISTAPAPANVPVGPPAIAAGTAPVPQPPVVLNPTAADEAKRLEAIAAEVRRRRALRQQAETRPPEKTQ